MIFTRGKYLFAPCFRISRTFRAKTRVSANFPIYIDRSISGLYFHNRSSSYNTFTHGMAPITVTNETNITELVQGFVNANKVAIFSKSWCPFCKKVKDLFRGINVSYGVLELDKIERGQEIQDELLKTTGQKTVPNVFINGNHLGGASETIGAHSEGSLLSLLNARSEYDYDLVVIGGGSGGLSCSKEAAAFGMKVAVLDFVKPSPQGSVWGLGGTCVNVGCIPKKLMHQAAILGHSITESKAYGWEIPEEKVKHNWQTLKSNISDYIGGLNWGYRVSLKQNKVAYLNAFGEFIGPNKLKLTNKKGVESEISGKNFVIAVGGRPRYPDIPGIEHVISSDDVFSLNYCPGKTLCIGAAYVSLECGGFLHGIGLDVTIMVRSILLRGFDQQIANKIGAYMEEHGVKFIRQCVPVKIEKIEDGQPGKYRVTGKYEDGTEYTDEYNTILMAVGRDPVTKGIGLDTVGVTLSKNGYVIVNDEDQTNIPNIYAVGDVAEGIPELTPVAIQAGKLLARRLFGGSNVKCCYTNVATCVFTPIEFGNIGYSEEDAIEKFGEEDLEIYHSEFWPLEWTIPHKENNVCYVKLICLKSENEKVVGFQVLGPNAGEITQGYAVAMNMGATYTDFGLTIGIHPTCSETFTTLAITKRSGADVSTQGC